LKERNENGSFFITTEKAPYINVQRHYMQITEPEKANLAFKSSALHMNPAMTILLLYC